MPTVLWRCLVCLGAPGLGRRAWRLRSRLRHRHPSERCGHAVTRAAAAGEPAADTAAQRHWPQARRPHAACAGAGRHACSRRRVQQASANVSPYVQRCRWDFARIYFAARPAPSGTAPSLRALRLERLSTTRCHGPTGTGGLFDGDRRFPSHKALAFGVVKLKYILNALTTNTDILYGAWALVRSKCACCA
jgi:hypothetical protein